MTTTHELADGARVRLRLTRPSDLRAIEGLTDSQTVARRYVFFDPRRRMVLAAAMPGPGGEQIVGLAVVDPSQVEVLTTRSDVEQLLREGAETLAIRRSRRAA
jgi:hypothetical protein